MMLRYFDLCKSRASWCCELVLLYADMYLTLQTKVAATNLKHEMKHFIQATYIFMALFQICPTSLMYSRNRLNLLSLQISVLGIMEREHISEFVHHLKYLSETLLATVPNCYSLRFCVCCGGDYIIIMTSHEYVLDEARMVAEGLLSDGTSRRN